MIGVASAGVSSSAAPSTAAEIDHVVDPSEPIERAERLRPAPRRVVIIGDSAAAGMRWNGALGGLQGFYLDHRLESCRRLFSRNSWRGREGRRPPTVYAELRDHVPNAGPRDVLVVATGYNDWHEAFPTDFGAVMQMASWRGFRTVAWLTYRDDVTYELPSDVPEDRSNYAFMNLHLNMRQASGEYPALQIWDHDRYTEGTVGWFGSDGVHQRPLGSWGVADWLPCPKPWRPGSPLEQACTDPDPLPPFFGHPDIIGLYFS